MKEQSSLLLWFAVGQLVVSGIFPFLTTIKRLTADSEEGQFFCCRINSSCVKVASQYNLRDIRRIIALLHVWFGF